jgi:tRNA (guanine-N7-)-methyltransferase
MQVGGKLSFRRRVRSVDTAGLPIVEGGEDPPTFAALVPERFAAVEIEVGPGKGAFLLAAAQARPDTFLLGIEAARPYAQYAAARLQAAGCQNALLLVDNAKLYLQDRVPEAALARLHVYFPDPWPKRRHRGRRFFTDDVIAVLERVLRPGGWLLVSTDNAAYAGQICRVLGAAAGLCRDPEEEARLLAQPPGHAFSPTGFEAKYLEEGRAIHRYAYRRRSTGS